MSRLNDRVRMLTGVEDGESAQRVARATMSVLFEQLAPADRAWLARAVPGQAGEPPPSALLRPADGLREFYSRVASREGVELGFAAEHAQSVCRALSELLDEDALQRLTSRLPDELAVLFRRAEGTVPPPHEHAHALRHTLSEGKIGSHKPLSEAAPQRAHRDSVARSDNPHGDTKLSSNHGTTQEREAETLAEYKPDSRSRRS